MARILDNLEILKDIVRRKPFGLISDMDGTLSEIPHNFLEWAPPPPTLRQLDQLVKQIELVAVVSGRKTEAIKEIINIEGVKYIGHYGMERWENGQAVLHPEVIASLAAMRALAAELEVLKAIEGMVIQDKYATVSVHYHLTAEPEKAKQQILDLLAKSPHATKMQLMDEKTNIGIVPKLDIDKGTAVTSLIKACELQGAIYLGDDVGDVPAFKAIRKARENGHFDALAILVTGQETMQATNNEADFTLNSVQETVTLLDWLVANTKPLTDL